MSQHEDPVAPAGQPTTPSHPNLEFAPPTATWVAGTDPWSAQQQPWATTTNPPATSVVLTPRARTRRRRGVLAGVATLAVAGALAAEIEPRLRQLVVDAWLS